MEYNFALYSLSKLFSSKTMILFRSDYSSFFSDSFLDSENRGDGRVDSFGNIKQRSINGIDWKINHGSVTLSTFSPQALLLSCTNNLANAAVPHLITTWRVGKLPKKRSNVNAMVKEKEMKTCFTCDCYNNSKEGEKPKQNCKFNCLLGWVGKGINFSNLRW